MFDGVRIIEDINLVDMTEDWSRVRSPGRARRRRRYGYPQNIKIIAVPKEDAYSIDGGRTLIMHPEMARQLRELVPKGRVELPLTGFMGPPLFR